MGTSLRSSRHHRGGGGRGKTSSGRTKPAALPPSSTPSGHTETRPRADHSGGLGEQGPTGGLPLGGRAESAGGRDAEVCLSGPQFRAHRETNSDLAPGAADGLPGDHAGRALCSAASSTAQMTTRGKAHAHAVPEHPWVSGSAPICTWLGPLPRASATGSGAQEKPFAPGRRDRAGSPKVHARIVGDEHKGASGSGPEFKVKCTSPQPGGADGPQTQGQ